MFNQTEDAKSVARKYVYASVKVGRFLGARCEEHREIIDRYALNGYRYVGYIPTVMTDCGKYTEIDLIFEMES